MKQKLRTLIDKWLFKLGYIRMDKAAMQRQVFNVEGYEAVLLRKEKVFDSNNTFMLRPFNEFYEDELRKEMLESMIDDILPFTMFYEERDPYRYEIKHSLDIRLLKLKP